MYFFRYHARLLFLACIIAGTANVSVAQKNKADSLLQLLNAEKTDTGRVKLMWQLASAANAYKPDTALLLAQQALFKSRKINYKEGESNSLKILANTFM